MTKIDIFRTDRAQDIFEMLLDKYYTGIDATSSVNASYLKDIAKMAKELALELEIHVEEDVEHHPAISYVEPDEEAQGSLPFES